MDVYAFECEKSPDFDGGFQVLSSRRCNAHGPPWRGFVTCSDTSRTGNLQKVTNEERHLMERNWTLRELGVELNGQEIVKRLADQKRAMDERPLEDRKDVKMKNNTFGRRSNWNVRGRKV